MSKFYYLKNIVILAAVIVSFYAAPLLYAKNYPIDDETEVFSALQHTDKVKILDFQKDILIDKDRKFIIQAGDEVTFQLNRFNLVGTGNFEFHTEPGQSDKKTIIKIIGSTTGINGGLKIFDNIQLDYDGIYTSGNLDILGKNVGDHVTVNFTEFGSSWNAIAATPKFIDSLPPDLDELAKDHEGTIIVGGDGIATLNVTNGNRVHNAETIVGARNTTETSILNISDKYFDKDRDIKKVTNWYAAGSFYIGYEGNGVTNINDGATVSAGSIGVGIAETGNGILNVTGTGLNPIENIDVTGKAVSQNTFYDHAYRNAFKINEQDPVENTTTVYIFGRNDWDTPPQIEQLKSQGTGIMKLTNGAHLVFDERATETPKNVSGYTPKLTLGTGESTVTNSLISGALKDWSINDSKTGVIDGSATTGNNSLTFDQSMLEGTLEIKIEDVTFKNNSVISPGYESYEYVYTDPKKKQFGTLNFTNTPSGSLTLDNTTKTYIDFDIHGVNDNADLAYANHPPTPDNLGDPLKVTIKDQTQTQSGYSKDNGRDLITARGTITLDGDIYFRPQAGYYSKNIDLLFLEASAHTDNLAKQFAPDRVHVEPPRWFENKRIAWENDGDHLLLTRHQSPFETAGNDANSKSVGHALDTIYNKNNNYSWLHILDWVWLMNDKELQKTLHQLAGEAKASSFYLPLQNQWRYAFERVNWSQSGNHVYFGTQNVANPKTAKNALWITPYYDYFHVNDDGNVGSTTTERVSFLAGYDHAIMKTPYFGAVSKPAFGLIFAYSQPKLNQGTSKIIADDYLLGAHFNTRLYEKYELKLWGGLGAQQYHLNRNVPVPQVNGDLAAKYTGTSWSGSVQAARPFYYRNLLVLRPLAALDLMVVNQNSATENGEYEQIILQYKRSKWTQLFARTGVRADFTSGLWNLNASLAYSYLLGGDQAPVSTHQFKYAGGESFEVQGNNLSRSFLNIGLGTQLHLNRLKTNVLFLQYNGNYAKYANAQTFAIGYQKLF